MYVISFLTATALLKHLQNRRLKYGIERSQPKIKSSVLRDQVASMYPIKVAIINNVLGGFFLGTREVFPNAELVAYINNSDSPRVKKLIDIESKRRFPESKSLEGFYEGMFTNVDMVFYKMKLGKRVAHFSNEYENWRDQSNIQIFEEALKKAKNPNFIIEISYSSRIFKDKDQVISELKKHSELLNNKRFYATEIDACPLTGQSDVRLFITSFPLIEDLLQPRISSFVNNLDPVAYMGEQILTGKELKKALFDTSNKVRDAHSHSMTGDFSNLEHGYPVKCAKKLTPNPRTRPYLLEDWRLKTDYPVLRYFSLEELERLAGVPTGWISNRGNSKVQQMLPIATNMFIAQYLMECFAVHNQFKFNTGVYHG